MARLMAFYKTPMDTAAFDAYYAAAHAPLAKTQPGLRAYDISSGEIAGKGDNYLIATLHFDAVSDIKAALATPEWQATVADLATFADGGVEVLIFETVDA